MANTRAAIKSLRQDKKKHDRNKTVKSELSSVTKKARILITNNDREGADSALKTLESKLDKATKNNIVKKNMASRRISRLRSAWSKIEA